MRGKDGIEGVIASGNEKKNPKAAVMVVLALGFAMGVGGMVFLTVIGLSMDLKLCLCRVMGMRGRYVMKGKRRHD